MAALQKSDLTLQIACWAISKLLICIVVSGFVAATFIQGPRLVPIWIVSVLATLIGHFEGMKKAANNKSDKDGK